MRLVTAERDGYFRDGYFAETGMGELHFFDPQAEFSIVERKLAHWTQAGTVCFITWRTHDSLPKEVVERWRRERFHWLRPHGINPNAANWREASSLERHPPTVPTQPPKARRGGA